MSHRPPIIVIVFLASCSVDSSGLRSLDGELPDAADGIDSGNAVDASVFADVPLIIPDSCSPGPELCNGLDDDCDSSTRVDGVDDPRVGMPCDDADSDLCEEGMTICVAGEVLCDEPAVDDLDVCDGMDNDCSAATPDGSGDPGVGVPCDGADDDMCEEGMSACVAGGVTCDDVTDTSTESCDGDDDDCDGLVDEGSGCPCDFRLFGGHAYQFCQDTRSWDSARDVCVGRGYHLVTIDGTAENDFVRDESRALRADRDWWLGYNDIAAEGDFVWVETGADGPFVAWRGTEPNGGRSENCAEMVRDSPGGWNDDDCGGSNRYVCEAP